MTPSNRVDHAAGTGSPLDARRVHDPDDAPIVWDDVTCTAVRDTVLDDVLNTKIISRYQRIRCHQSDLVTITSVVRGGDMHFGHWTDPASVRHEFPHPPSPAAGACTMKSFRT